MRLTESEYYALIRRTGTPQMSQILPPPAPVKPSKFHNIITECDNIKFQSKKEEAYYRELRCRQHAGEVKFFLTQVPFRLKAGYKHLLDFMVIRTDGVIEYVEVKGRDLPMGKMKRKMVEEEYGIRIEVV